MLHVFRTEILKLFSYAHSPQPIFFNESNVWNTVHVIYLDVLRKCYARFGREGGREVSMTRSAHALHSATVRG
jgi:hypothetical protein